MDLSLATSAVCAFPAHVDYFRMRGYPGTNRFLIEYT
jgi:hypothetical protein